MMSKYILAGGFVHKSPDGGKSFCEAVVGGFSGSVKILDCLFAKPQDKWEVLFAGDIAFFEKHIPGMQLDFCLADPKRFTEQVAWANAITIRAGSDESLADILGGNTEWEKELSGKTVAGSSAGANIISAYYYHLDVPRVSEGLGILPIKVMCHYKSDYNAPNVDWAGAYDELKKYGEDLQIIALREGEFQILHN